MKNELEFLEYLQKELDELEYGEGVSYNLTFLNRDIEERKSKLKNNGDVSNCPHKEFIFIEEDYKVR